MVTDDKYTTLKHSKFFGRIPESDLIALAESMSIEQFDAGEYICRVGDIADRVFVIKSGEIDILLTDKKKPIRTMVAGDVIGEYGMFTNEARSANILCKTNATLMTLEYYRFEAFLELFPNTTYELFKQTVQRLIAVEQK